MSLKKNDEIELYIESFTSEGSGIGHFDGMAVFVGGAAAGDTVIAHIIKVKKTYAVGKTVKIIKRSDDRIASDCEAFPSCGGCAFRHISYDAELKMKKQRVEDAFLRLAKIDIKAEEIIGADSTDEYRNKAEYPVSFDVERLKIGFYAARSHRIIDCGNCRLQPSVFSEIVKIIRIWIAENGISVYDAEKHKGLIRHIYLRQGAVTKEIMVCLVINGDTLPKTDRLLEKLLIIPEIKSVVININKDKTNVILGETSRTVWGEDHIYDILCSVKIRLSPLSFYQVNHAQAEKLYSKAAEFAGLQNTETVLDMYCGAGTIGLSMAHRAKKIIGAEIIPEAVEDAKFNAELNGIDNAEYYCADAAKASLMLKEKGVSPQVVILDPPRKGCDAELIKTVSEMSPERVVYVSCDPSTLARDCAVFKDFGYEVKRLAAVDMFPRTTHVETVVMLSHK